MKKNYFIGAMLLAVSGLFPANMNAQDSYAPSASKEVYQFDFMGKDQVMLDLFYNALQQGRNYPTVEEFEAKGISMQDLEFLRSHVRHGNIMSRADRVVPQTNENRNLWLNLPAGSGKDGSVGFPSGTFASDVFSMWNYTNLFGMWNHSLLSAPGAWLDAAHKNGSSAFSGIKFFDTTGGRGQGAGSYVNLIKQKNEDGTFKYAEPLINAFMFFGSDGINYNFEDNGWSSPEVIAFHKTLYKLAEKKGFKNFHIGMYASPSSLSPYVCNGLFGNSEGRTAETMLNYGGAGRAAQSAKVAEEQMGTTEGLYQGFWIVGMNQSWTLMNRTDDAKKVGICLWGEHANSRFWSYNSGGDAFEQQINYQKLLERGMSGGYRNPIHRPALQNSGNEWEGEVETGGRLATFGGMASMIPERSAIQGELPFATHFNLGNGERYNYKGKKAGNGWYNMANQDFVPTYRWLITEVDNDKQYSEKVNAQFVHYDAYTGGACLQLDSKQGGSADIILYRTDLKVNGNNPYVKVALKTANPEIKDAHLKVIVESNGEWKEAAIPALEGKTWQEFQQPIALGDKVTRIGLRVDNAPAGYKMYVGKLEINTDHKVQPMDIDELFVTVKKETTKNMALKLMWTLDAQNHGDRKDYGLLFNDEANIDHFEILYKDGEEGKTKEIGRTTQWATVIENIIFESENENPYIGVTAVGKDLKTHSPIKWVKVSRANANQLPELEEIDTYGTSVIDPAAAGLEVALNTRYLTKVKTEGATQNLNFSRYEPVKGENYLHVEDQVLKVEQGQTIRLFFKAFSAGDGLKWCLMKGWLDLNGSGTFEPELISEAPEVGECLFEAGTVRKGTEAFQTTGVWCEFKVPEDAHVGKSRLRMVFSDAWFAGTLLPTGKTAKGFSIDFDVEIGGDPEGQRGFVDLHDDGTPEEPIFVGIEDVIINSEAALSTAQFADGIIQLQNVEKAWVYTLDGKLVKFAANAPQTIDATHFTPGAYLVKMYNNHVTRTEKVIIK